jgi:hypothetical protein
MSYDTGVQDWIIEVTGYSDQQVIRSQQVGRRPDGNHATYLSMSGRDSDYAHVEIKETDPVSDNVEAVYTAPKQLTYSINIYDPDGEAILTELWKARYKLAPRLALRAEGMVLLQKGDSNEVPTLGDTSWRRHFRANFVFSIFTVDTEEYEKIDRILINGVWKDPQPDGTFDDLDVVIDTN